MPAEKDEKTEAPTPRRRMESRRKGQVARSQDLNAAVMMLSGIIALRLLGPAIWLLMLSITQAALDCSDPTSIDELVPFFNTVILEVFKTVAPLMLVLFAVGLAVLYAQVGWLFTTDPLIPSLDKLNPINGLKRIFSVKSAMMALINVGKILVVGTVAYLTLRDSAAEIIFAFTVGLPEVFLLGAELVERLGLRLAVVLLVLAILDYAWQHYQHEKNLKMTKEEVKDEMRSMEGDPVVKRRRREVQLKLAAQRLQKEVPQADVVITNPTHLSIAIKYNAESMPAPKVIAKGADYLALKIRQIAEAHGIPIVEKKPLVRAMYNDVEPGDYIPEKFYHAIAEILAYVYELTGRRPLVTA